MLKLILVAFLGFYTVPLSAMVVSKATSLNIKPQLLVVGGGIGGISSAYDAKKIMSDLVDITVISDKEYFYFTPSNPWVAIGYRQPQDIRVSLTSVLPEHGIHFVHSRASSLNPEINELKLENGSTLKYDFLIVATGPRLAYEMVPGADLSHGFTHSICTTHHAQEAKVAIDKLVQDPGPVVVGALQGASCFGPAYEFAFLLHHELKKRGGQALVDQCPMTFVTSEPYTGHLGLKGAGDSVTFLTKLLKEQNIRSISNCKVNAIHKGKVSVEYIVDETPDGKTQKEEIPSKFNMFIPPFHGLDVWKKVHKLTDEKGMLLIDDHQQSIAYPNIFGVGACVKLLPVEKTPIPTGAPKTGYMIESMGTAAVNNILAMLNYQSGKAKNLIFTKALLNALCIGDLGDSGSVILLQPQMPPRTFELAMHGKFAKLAKIAFEKYFLYKVESGDTDPYYEKYMLELVGLKRYIKDGAPIK